MFLYFHYGKILKKQEVTKARKIYSERLKIYISDLVKNVRAEYDLTQEEMATKLMMDTRSYSEIERGKNSCGLLTFLLLIREFDLKNVEFLDEILKCLS